MGKTLLYIGAGILFLIGLGLAILGGFYAIASTSASGSPSWLTFGLGFGCVGFSFWRVARGWSMRLCVQARPRSCNRSP